MNSLLKLEITCVRQTPLTGPFCGFLAFCSGSKSILLYSSWSTGAFCSEQRIQKRSGIFSTFSFSQLHMVIPTPVSSVFNKYLNFYAYIFFVVCFIHCVSGVYLLIADEGRGFNM